MKNTKITTFQYCIMAFFLLNSFIPLIGYHTLTKLNKTTSFLSILIGCLFIMMFIQLVKNIFSFQKNKTILQKIEILFPKSKKLILLLCSMIMITVLLYSLNNLVVFINYYILKDINLIMITASLLLTILYCLNKSMDSIFRLTEIFFYIYIFIFLFSFLGMGKFINLYNVKPLLSSSLENTILSSLLYFISAIIPIFLLGIIPHSHINFTPDKTQQHILQNAVKFSTLLIFINLLTIISTLGIQLANIYQNPDMILYKKISFLNILERIETTIAFNNILNSFFFILMAIYVLKESIIKIFNIKKEKEIISLSLIILILMITSTLLTIPKNLYLISSVLILIIMLTMSFKLFIGKYSQHETN
ncbi:MAG: GerAB/ArcD/ProY family transporter [bacterium]|nr:GerAB/ArcD/ProY family transporter [bacterium]